MNKLLQLRSVLMYFLSILVCFIFGAFLPTLTGAFEKIGMAGGATVVMSGMIAAFIGLIASIVIVRSCASKTIRIVNWILTTMLVIFVAIMAIMTGPHLLIG